MSTASTSPPPLPSPLSSEVSALIGVDVEALPLEEVEEVICRWAGRIAAATCGWLLAVAAFDRRGGWSGVGMGSCAHWLAWRCGLGLRTAREQVATARALEGLPLIRAAFAAGMLSYAKVRAVTRVADSATEGMWLTRARHCSAGQLERLVRSYRQANGDPRTRQAARRVTWTFDGDGMLRLRAVLSPDEGARLIAALNAARASLEDTTPLAPDHPPADDEAADDAGDAGDAAERDRQRDADALVALADGFLDRPAPGLMSPGHTLTVHLTTQPAGDTPTDDAKGLQGVARIGTGAWAQGDGGVGLSRHVLERLGCDGLIRALVTDPDGNPLHLGRRQRFPGQRLRDAVHLRDQGRCQYPGCGHTRWLHLHHLTWWGRGGDTDINRLLLLCSTHHRAVHDENISLGRDTDGTVTARTVDGRVLVGAPSIVPGPQPAGILARATRHVESIHVLRRHRRRPTKPTADPTDGGQPALTEPSGA
ncbi:HNH endonuclease [Frankia sp. AiPs1]|uniref:HNH endonuclease n=1 Tax=Frankia sp. AiPs1 TaxID=573493 RepID=UPI0020441148|nr:HNH endonuclease signature motif containing protein [Frankia sp. AiPs1]MCM3922387.1 HNH endonuclease [Frankia sp. AiPs1]